MRRATCGLLALVVGMTGSVLTAPAASASALADGCADVEAVFARGSGQTLGAGESSRFLGQLEDRIASSTTSVHFYELGADAGGYGGHSYEAIDVDNPLNGNPIGAKFSGGRAFDYGRSVDSGVGELYTYLLERQEACRAAGSRFVLGGYSQGAQVVGQTLEKLAAERPGSTDRIDFAALFGDPKLHLPEGEGLFPPACRGEDYSTWRRVVPDCDTDNGSLGARQPYVPAASTSTVGLWCADRDFVCGSDKRVWMTEGHGTYPSPGGDIDAAVREIAERLRATLPPEKAAGLETGISIIGTGTTGLDVAFVIDTTGSMGSYIDQAKEYARSLAASVAELRGRVALIAYKDAGDSYTATVLSGLNGDLTEFQADLAGLTPDGGGDTPEALLHALMTTFDGLDWRPGATKAAVVLTDAGFHDPDLVDGSTIASVAQRSLEIDPVNVYPVVPSWLAPQYEGLASLTSGQVVVNDGDTVASLTAALTKIRNRPVPLLPLTDYYGRPGETFTFDASRSYVADSTIVRYDWDFDGDGTFEQTTSVPRAEHTYAAVFDGTMQVRVTAADGGLANASAFVHVATTFDRGTPAAPLDLAVQEVATAGGLSTVRLSWTPADDRAASWAVSVDGVAVGHAPAGTTSVELNDVQRGADVVLGVAGMTAESALGEAATVVLPAADRSAATPPTVDVIPGSVDNPVNTRARGVVPVAVLSTATFDATALDVRGLCFGDAEAPGERDCTESHGRGHSEDVDGDGRADLVLHFEVRQTGIDPGDTRACVSGRLPDGSSFESCDAVRAR